MTFNLRRALRRIKPHRFTLPLRRRTRSELIFVPDLPEAGIEVLLDTCVYIDVLQGKTPPPVDALLRVRTLNHLAVCVAELTHNFGRLHPAHPGTNAVLDKVEDVVTAIPPHRLQNAHDSVVAEAGILAGLVFRLCDLPAGREGAALNDAILYLHALTTGQMILTRNLRDFDIMNQVLPEGRVLFYDPVG